MTITRSIRPAIFAAVLCAHPAGAAHAQWANCSGTGSKTCTSASVGTGAPPGCPLSVNRTAEDEIERMNERTTP